MLLVLGIGNLLMRDDGVGVHVARAVQALGSGRLPAGSEVVDGGTLGLELLPLVAHAEALVLIDAADLRAPPGTVRLLRGVELLADDIPSREVGVADLLSAARLAGDLPERLALVAIQPGRVEVGLDLTPAVRDAVPAAVDLVRRQLVAFASSGGTDRPAGSRTARDAGAARGGGPRAARSLRPTDR